ncbi:MAG: hypothetical protein IM607_18780 [Cytophagales bacterium]|nr:hypothetical protein [Cytophagales bacterium]
MTRQPARFSASLPLLITSDKTTKRVSNALWETLPAENRDFYRGCRYVTNARGIETLKSYNVYRRVDFVPPYPNPAIKKLRSKLKRQRVKFTERLEERNGESFLCIATN